MEILRIILYTSFCAILIITSIVDAGPVRTNKRSNRQRRYTETFPAELTVMPSDNATLTTVATCLKDGYEVPRDSVHCEKRVGCRAIQKTGQCCPDYQCECEKDGKIYGNGEKLNNNDSPCQVCYCQGGEISCNNVTCYIRNDCEAKYIAGRCCPEYDNCPPLEHVKFQSSKDTNNNNVSDNFENSSHTIISLTDNHPAENPSTQSTTTTEIDHNANGNALGFKIKEITEKKEIRITDQNQQPNVNKKFQTTTIRATTTSTTSNSPQTTENVDDYSGYSSSTTEDNLGYFSSSTEYPNVFENTEHLLNEEQSLKNVRHTDLDGKLADSTEETDFLSDNKINGNKHHSEEIHYTSHEPNYASSTTEDYGSTPIVTEIVPKESPAVVVLGNNVLIVDTTKENPITLIKVKGAMGLQQGVDENLDEGESYDIHDSYPVLHARSTLEPSTPEAAESSPIPVTSTESAEYSSEPVFHTVYYSGNPLENLEVGHNTTDDEYSGSLSGSGSGFGSVQEPGFSIDLSDASGSGSGALPERNVTKLYPVDSFSSESQDFIRIIPTSVKPELTSSSGDYSSDIFEISSTETASSPEISSEIIHETTFYESTNDISTEISQSTQKTPEASTVNHFVVDDLVPIQKTYIEDEDTHDLIDPGFGRIPDDFQFHAAPSHLEDEIAHTRQLSPKKHDEFETPIAQLDPRKIPDNIRALLIGDPHNFMFLKNKPAPGEPHLIPEWERNNTEEIKNTVTKIKLENILTQTVNPLHADHSSSEEIDKKFNKDVEPTTIKYMPSNAAEKFSTEDDNSSNQSSSSPVQYHPDHDAESIRLQVAPTTDKASVISNESTETSETKVSGELETIQTVSVEN